MSLFKAVFGTYAEFVAHIVRATLVFIIVLGCIYAARTVVPKLFPPGDYTSAALHLVDSYAALLGTVGYVVWMSLDLFFLLKGRVMRGDRHDE